MLLLALACHPTTTSSTTPTSSTSPSTETPSDTGTVPLGDPFSDLASHVHPQMGSIVVVDWTQRDDGTTHVEFSFDEGSWLSSPARVLTAGPHEELLLGVPFGSAVTWRVVEESVHGTLVSPDQAAANDPLPLGAPVAHVATLDEARTDPQSPYVFLSLAQPGSFGKPWWILIVDRRGRVLWAARSRAGRVSMQPRVAKDGRSLWIDENSFWAQFDRGADSSIVNLLIDGTVLNEFPTPGEHHDWTDLPDGGLAYGAAVGYYDDERLVRIAPDGTATTLWDCEDWLQDIDVNDYCMSNTLNYDAPSDTFLFSFFTLETIVRIDASSGDVTSWYGHTDGAYAFDPPNSAFWWQHGGYLTDAGTLLTSSDLTTNGVETVVREYELDDANHTLHEIWDFGIGEGVYGYEMGEAIRLPNGDTFHNYGELARLREATPDREVVWDIAWDSDAIGRSMPLSDLYALAPERP